MAFGLIKGGKPDVVGEGANVTRWINAIGARPAVQRGSKVNRTWGAPADQLHERHDASDFETMTQDRRTQVK